MKSRRRTVRRSLSLRCQVVRELDFRLVGEATLDVSAGGLLVPTDLDVEVGDALIVSFQATDLGLWFDTEARVARVVAGRRESDRGRAAGVTFSSLSSVQRLILRGAFGHQPPPPPARERVDYAAQVLSA